MRLPSAAERHDGHGRLVISPKPYWLFGNVQYRTPSAAILY